MPKNFVFANGRQSLVCTSFKTANCKIIEDMHNNKSLVNVQWGCILFLIYALLLSALRSHKIFSTDRPWKFSKSYTKHEIYFLGLRERSLLIGTRGGRRNQGGGAKFECMDLEGGGKIWVQHPYRKPLHRYHFPKISPLTQQIYLYYGQLVPIKPNANEFAL